MGVEITGKERHRLPENKIEEFAMMRLSVAGTIHEDTDIWGEAHRYSGLFPPTHFPLVTGLCDLQAKFD